jgi:integrase
MAEWLELKAGAAPETARAYEARWRLYLAPELGHIRLRELEAIDVARALRRLEGRRGERVERISASTVEAAYKVLSTALNDARRAGKVAANVAELVEIERHAPEVIPPSQAEIDAILEYLGGHWSAPILRALRWTGARHGEVLGLRRRDVDGAAGLVTFRRQTTGRRLKTHASHRTILVPATLADELEGMPARLRSELVFSTGPGAPIDERNVLRAWREATDALGIRPPAGSDLREYRPHDLRHAFATMLLEAGTALPVVSAWLGHGSLRELDRYGHVRPIPGGDSAHRILEAFGPDTAARLGLAAGIPR